VNGVSDTSRSRNKCDGYVCLSGDLDLATVPEFAAEAIKAVQTAAGLVTVEVSDVTFIDSAGVGLLADVLALGTARGQAVVLVGASAGLHALLLQCGLESLFSYR
jgi:anti-anti-sigma factor